MHRSHALDLSHTFCRIPVDGSWNQHQPTAQYLLNTPAVGSMSGHFYINGCRIWHEIRRGIQFLSSFPVVHPPPPRPLGSVPRGGWSPAVCGGSHMYVIVIRAKKIVAKTCTFYNETRVNEATVRSITREMGLFFTFWWVILQFWKKWILVAEMALFIYIHINFF